MGYSIEFEPSDATNAIRTIELKGEVGREDFTIKAHWSRPKSARVVGVRVDCERKALLGYWRHLHAYRIRPRQTQIGLILPCVYDLQAAKGYDLVSHFDAAGEHREIMSFNSNIKNLHIELQRDDVPAFLHVVGDLLHFATGQPPRP